MPELQSFFDELQSQLRTLKLEISDDLFFENLLVGDDEFIDHEGELWDFKESWPFSYSDPYFLGLAKHVCGFANNMGGILIFNVLDDSRIYHQSKVRTNFDAFERAISNICFPMPKIEYRLFTKGLMKIPVVVIYPNSLTSLPSVIVVPAKTKVPRWVVRSGPKTVDATAKDIPTLFCRPQVRAEGEESQVASVAMPPSPATMRNFVKRNEIMTRVFDWLHDPSQPRAFLYGRGGSGKTTIAYEVARHVAEYGARISGVLDDDVSSVIFVSAKQVELNVFSGQSREFGSVDFSSSRELYEAIVILSGWSVDGDLDNYSDQKILTIVSEVFDAIPMLVIIDDIDTITTKGRDAGLEALFLAMARSKKPSKVLYTMRNVPTYALSNSIEVPGLSTEEELGEFFSLCVEKFKVPRPTLDERNLIVAAAEGRPLTIESICVLRRSAGTYDKAVSAFLHHAGDGAREYVFRREWDVLPPNNRARSVLAALALLKGPISPEGLKIILSYDDDVLRDAIGEALEMFIDVDESSSGSLYSIGALTRGFVERQAQLLDRFEVIKARVETYQKTSHPKLPQLAALRASAERFLFFARKDNNSLQGERAWHLVNDEKLPAILKEAPAFKELIGEIAVQMDPPKLAEAREAFYYANSMKFHLSPEVLRRWFQAEARSGSGGEHCPKIARIVVEGRGYRSTDRIEFQLLENSRKYQLAKEIRFETPERAIDLLSEALLGHLETFRQAILTNHIRLYKIEEYARNTAYLMFLEMDRHFDLGRLATFFDKASRLDEVYFDPLFNPAIEYLPRMATVPTTKEGIGRLLNAMSRFSKTTASETRWNDTGAGKALDKLLVSLVNDLANALSRRGG